MGTNKKITTFEKDRITRIMSFLNLGFKDYIAARVLLNSKLNLQGAIFASTAIEKYFKALLGFYGNNSKGHLKQTLLNAIKNVDSKLYSHLNESFLKLLISVYKLRYFDNDFDTNFNILIMDKIFLTELDFTVSQIQDSLIMKKGEEVVKTIYHVYVENKNPQLYDSNYMLLGIPKEEIINQRKFGYAIAYTSDNNFLEMTFETMDNANIDDFMKPGIIFKN